MGGGCWSTFASIKKWYKHWKGSKWAHNLPRRLIVLWNLPNFSSTYRKEWMCFPSQKLLLSWVWGSKNVFIFILLTVLNTPVFILRKRHVWLTKKYICGDTWTEFPLQFPSIGDVDSWITHLHNLASISTHSVGKAYLPRGIWGSNSEEKKETTLSIIALSFWFHEK